MLRALEAGGFFALGWLYVVREENKPFFREDMTNKLQTRQWDKLNYQENIWGEMSENVMIEALLKCSEAKCKHQRNE